MPTGQKIIRNAPPIPGRKPTLIERLVDRDEAEPLGARRVVATLSHDLFGTKDVQDVITATYVWMTDEFGHTTLGIVPTVLLCWLWGMIVGHWIVPTPQWAPWIRIGGDVLIVLGLFGLMVKKENDDRVATKARAGHQFEFDYADITWNVVTVLYFTALGGLLGLSPFIDPWLLPVVIVAGIYPTIRIGFWWLRRKVAFQQAGLPYLYRLANFSSLIDQQAKDAIVAVANLANRPVGLLRVWFGRDVIPPNDPAIRHLLIAGPLAAGKTSLAVGIGTEFAFALGIGRYLSLAELTELIADLPARGGGGNVEYNDGRVLWPWRQCDLLVVDDVDGGLPITTSRQAVMERPAEVRQAIEGAGEKPLAWLGAKRSVWVLGDVSMVEPWRQTIAGMLGIRPDQILTVILGVNPMTSVRPAAMMAAG